ncbi:MAG: hypothetical protein MUP19_10570 [Candidatus Aminicenantes bacterium]|nr:hypothetical protein [Candidatus Aminicenantes bacterium]
MKETGRASYHDDTCADLAKIWFLPVVKDKVKLNIQYRLGHSDPARIELIKLGASEGLLI